MLLVLLNNWLLQCDHPKQNQGYHASERLAHYELEFELQELVAEPNSDSPVQMKMHS
jgi:hypothetical protein